MPTKTDNAQAFTAYLELPLYRRLKLQALEERRPMIAIMRDALLNYLDLFELGGNGKRKR